jgi:hypothetical protein
MMGRFETEFNMELFPVWFYWPMGVYEAEVGTVVDPPVVNYR